MTAPATFVLRDVVAGPADAPILRGFSVDIPCRGITAIAGVSGSGKTTFLRLLNRLDDPLSGTITLDGRPLAEWEPSTLRRRVAMLFQHPPVFPGSVLDNFRVADRDVDERRAADVMERVGLPVALMEQSAESLSGGEAQRMCMARALLTEPAIILADEPTASLDTAAQQRIEELGIEIARSGVPIVWVTHDIAQLRRLADHALVIAAGRVLAFGHLPELDVHEDRTVRTLVGAPT